MICDLDYCEKNNYWKPDIKDKEYESNNINKFSCELDKLAQKYNADKGQYHEMSNKYQNAIGLKWSDEKKLIMPGHNYVELYEKYFHDRKSDKISILEIGMGNYPTNGYSLQMWLDYFPNAEIDIIDINNQNFQCNFEYDKKRVKFHRCDQDNINDLNNFVKNVSKKFDIIIDDGSHIPKHQILTYNLFFNNILNINGIYVVEDLFESVEKDYHNNFPLYIGLENLKIQSGCLCDKIKNNEYLNNLISSIHMYRGICFIFKGRKITR